MKYLALSILLALASPAFGWQLWSSDSDSISTAKTAGSADFLLLRTAPDTTGAGFMGPATTTTTPYYLQLPATPPTNGQVAIFGNSASGTVNGATANIIPVTYGTNGSGGSMVYPGAGVPVSTGSAWGTSLNITAISDSTGTTSSTTAASATAVKAAYDLAATKGTGTVTAVSVATANGVSGTSSGGATPALTITLGAITPSSVAATGPVSGTTSEIDGHAAITLTAAQMANTTIYNTGQAAADVALTLPTAAAGMAATFTVGTAQTYKWGVRAGATDKIYILNADGTITAGSDNGYARMTNAQVGQMFACWTFKTDSYDWMCKQVAVGTSTFAAN